jgi:hypothetical protein
MMVLRWPRVTPIVAHQLLCKTVTRARRRPQMLANSPKYSWSSL